jgi:hypothetical protein
MGIFFWLRKIRWVNRRLTWAANPENVNVFALDEEQRSIDPASWSLEQGLSDIEIAVVPLRRLSECISVMCQTLDQRVIGIEPGSSARRRPLM